MQLVLEVKNLLIKFKNEVIVKNLSFKVEKGDFLTILGPNSSGKTLLAKCLLGLFQNFSGKILWQKNLKVNYLPQGLSQIIMNNFPLSVNDFFNFKRIKKERVLEFLSNIGFKNGETLLKKRISNLSFGQFQKIFIAFTLIDNPDVIILDEPNIGLDLSGKNSIYSLLADCQKKNITIILITHELNIVFRYSNKIICLAREGSCQGTAKEILTPQYLKKVYGKEISFYEHNH